jgi:adenylate cyclase
MDAALPASLHWPFVSRLRLFLSNLGLRLSPMRIAVLLGVGLAVVRLVGFAPLSAFDARAVDLRLRARGPEPASPEVVIVAIDNDAIAKMGRWPWSRPTLARLLEKIDAAAPAVIGFDIVQSEPTAAPDFSALEQRVDAAALAQLRKAWEGGSPDDKALAEAIAKSGRVVLGYFFDFSGRESTPRVDDSLTSYGAVQSDATPPEQTRIPAARAVVSNLPELSAAARATGFFNTLPDTHDRLLKRDADDEKAQAQAHSGDGHYRRVPMVLRYGERMAMPLSLSMLMVARPELQPRLITRGRNVENVQLGKQPIPTDEDGQVLLNYRGPGKTFPHIPAADLLEGRVEAERLRGKLVLVGVTATAVGDVRATAFDGVYPGVEIHATALDNILTNDFLQQPKWIVLLEMGAILFSALVLGASLGRLRGVMAALIASALVLFYVAVSQWLFLATGVPLGFVYPIVAIAVVYMSISVHHFVTVDLEKRRTREAFSRYLNPELARLVSENPEMLKLGGTRKSLTVLFSDIRGFTSISEGLEPETLVEVLNEYLGEMTGIVFEHDGTLDKYIGDAIMAVWGAPVACENHAERACAAALEMGRRLREKQPEWVARGWPKIAAGIGLNTGEMVAGNMGSHHHLSYTVMGDNVNLGSRLEGLTKTYGVSLLVAEATVEAAGDGFLARELDLVAVKGKALPVRIFEMVGRAGEESEWKDLLDSFGAALALFRGMRWQEAFEAFSALLARYPDDGPTQLYVKRSRNFVEVPPPPDWAGITVMESK